MYGKPIMENPAILILIAFQTIVPLTMMVQVVGAVHPDLRHIMVYAMLKTVA